MLLAALVLASSPAGAEAQEPRGELRVAIGVFLFADDGLDFHVGYRPQQSRWQYGLRLARWTDEWETASGIGLTQTTKTLAGPTLNYFFRPEARGSWYLGASLLRWSQEERSLSGGGSDKDATTAPFFGGGYSGRLGGSFYYNWGIFLSPSRLETRTADSEEQSTGADVQLQIGVAF